MNNIQDKNKETTFEGIDKSIEELSLRKSLLLDEYLSSKDPHELIKAKDYLQNMENKKKKEPVKAYVFSPEQEFYSGMGYKSTLKSVTYDLLRGMGKTPIIHSVVTTRIEQIQNFNKFTTDTQREGWTIRPKPGLFDKPKKAEELKDNDKKVIESIATFIQNGGNYNKWEQNADFDDFIRMFVKDSLELDQGVFEVERDRKGDLFGYTPLDGGTFRLLETIDPNYKEKEKYNPINGFYPIYGQVYNQQILKHPETKEPIVYYPWELCMAMRNKSTDIKSNGYGKSELEILIEVITYLLWGFQYNGNFFKQGSNPRGFFVIEEGFNQGTMNDFRSAWRNMVTGVQNSHKLPILEGKGIRWEDMQTSNKDMEFQLWNEFLMLVTCSVYKIDPSELGFHFKNQSEMFGQQGQKERLDHSQNKGLKPPLMMMQKKINKYIVSEMDDRFEFIWTGINLEDETQMLENDIKKVGAGFVSMEDMFQKYSERKFNDKKDTILNPVYWQAQQSKMYGGEESNEAVDQMTGEPDVGTQNPFDEYEKSLESDPISSAAITYINKMLKK